MYLFVYKTIHKNGRYYIGRHQTENLNDGYLGSGKWVTSIKDKSTLSREIIVETDSFEKLCELEEYYINLHWDDPLCMNMKKASIGMTSEDAFNMVKVGLNPFQTRKDGTSISQDRVKSGTHQLLKRADGTSFTLDRTKAGLNPLQTRPDGTNIQTDKVKEGTHHFQTRPDGTNIQTDRVKNGTHNFLQNKGLVPCYSKQGEYKRIPKEQYDSQSGPMENWEWVFNTSKEGKRRKFKL